MREMVLNHASVCAPDANRECVTQWLKDLVDGMAQLGRVNAMRRRSVESVTAPIKARGA